MQMLQAYLATVPYCNNVDSEGHYQQMMYVIFSPCCLLVNETRRQHQIGRF